MEVQSASDSRSLSLKDLYQADGANPHTIKAGEMATRIFLPAMPSRTGSAFMKLAKRQTLDFALVNVAATVSLESDGIACHQVAAVASGSVVAPIVLSVEWLVGREMNPEVLVEAASEAVKGAAFVNAIRRQRCP